MDSPTPVSILAKLKLTYKNKVMDSKTKMLVKRLESIIHHQAIEEKRFQQVLQEIE